MVVWQLNRAFRSAADGAAVIQALAARGVRFHSLDLPSEAADSLDGGIGVMMRAVGEIGRSFVSERTLRVIADRRERGLPVGGQAPVGWRIIGLRARETKSKKSSREYSIDDQERRLAEAIHAMRQAGTSIERIAVWLMTQREYPTNAGSTTTRPSSGPSQRRSWASRCRPTASGSSGNGGAPRPNCTLRPRAEMQGQRSPSQASAEAFAVCLLGDQLRIFFFSGRSLERRRLYAQQPTVGEGAYRLPVKGAGVPTVGAG